MLVALADLNRSSSFDLEKEDDQLAIDGEPNGNTSTEGPSNERYNLKAFQLERE